MSVSYVRPTWEDFESWFDAHYEWEEVYPKGTAERVVAIPLPVDHKEIRIFTTVNKSDGDGRDKGSDAIRTVVWDTEFDVPVGGREATKRIRTDNDPKRYLKNMHKKVHWLFQNWRIFNHKMRCPDCDGVLRGASGEYGEFLFCSDDDCDYSESLPDKQCPECNGGMKLLDGQYGEFYSCLSDSCDNTENA